MTSNTALLHNVVKANEHSGQQSLHSSQGTAVRPEPPHFNLIDSATDSALMMKGPPKKEIMNQVAKSDTKDKVIKQ